MQAPRGAPLTASGTAMKRTPSALFAILTEDDEKARDARARPFVEPARASLDAVRASQSEPGIPSGTGSGVSEDTARGGDNAKAALSTISAVTTDADDPKINDQVLQNMLGSLYVRYESLSDLEEIGAGGFASVHRASYTHDNGMTQIVAVKQLLKSRLNSKQDLHDFIAEANLWRKLKSKDVVKLVGIGASDLNTFASITSSMYIVCEFMEGGTLREAIERQMMSAKKQVYRYSDVFRWFIGISRAVKYLHSCRPTIVHRDLKPENVMLTALDMSVSEGKVLDLGLHMRKSARHTLPGEVEGSFYGGNAYDAVQFNGSVTAGRIGKTLAEKVKAVENVEVDAGATASPPRTNTKHSGSAAGNALRPIVEDEHENDRQSFFSGRHRSTDTARQGPQDGRSSAEGRAAAAEIAPPIAAPSGENVVVSSSSFSSLESSSRPSVPPPPVAAVSRSASSQTRADSGSSQTPETQLTTKVGSWLYMAPEMVSGDKYSEKVDVYSLAVMLYEALSFRLNVMRLAMGREPQAISDYATQVAAGHREKIPKNWPEAVRSLLEDAWQQDASLRIPASEFLARISDIIDGGVAREMDENCKPAVVNPNTDCGCGCSVM